MIGRKLGVYEFVEKLGEGGMGEVWKALDTRLHRMAAIKILPPAKGSTADQRQRFLQEAQAASALNHPNIITIYGIDRDGDTDYIAMEYVKGSTLERLIGRKGLPLKTALEYGAGVASGLAAAHAAGLVHRDLKPGNVMVRDDGQVKVLDFGLAAASILPGGVLLFLPKCPLCLAAWLTVVTGIGISAAAAAYVRELIVVFSGAAVALAAAQIVRPSLKSPQAGAGRPASHGQPCLPDPPRRLAAYP